MIPYKANSVFAQQSRRLSVGFSIKRPLSLTEKEVFWFFLTVGYELKALFLLRVIIEEENDLNWKGP